MPEASPSTTVPSKPPKRSKNDQKIIDWMTNRIAKLDADLAAVRGELEALKSKPLPSSEREAFLLAELETVNHQLECKFGLYIFRVCIVLPCN